MSRRSLFDLKGKTALVTGSGQGIGLAIASGLAQYGARVVLNDRNDQRLEATAAALAGEGLFVESAVFDVTDAVACKDGVGRIESSLGAIDILITPSMSMAV